MYERLLAPILAKTKKSVLLLGPRQTGKTTLLGALKADRTIQLSSERTYFDYITQPSRLEGELRAEPPNIKNIFIDEVQRVPALLNVVQTFIDEDPNRFRFLLSGSSARKLVRGQANLLPGRVHVHYLHPLLTAELGGAFRLEKVLAYGSLPGIYAEKDNKTREHDLRSYVSTYLKEEIQAEAMTRDIGGYARLLNLVAAWSGKLMNLNAICKDAGIRYETARRYLQMLEDTLIVFRVPAWSGSDRSRLISHDKYYLFDLGVRNAILNRPLDLPQEDELGLLFEHWIAYELHRRTFSIWPALVLYHYRTRHGAEVDFVLEIGKEVWAIEVKSSRNISESDASGIRSMADRVKKVHRKIIIFTGPRKQTFGDIEAIPFEDFLAELPC